MTCDPTEDSTAQRLPTGPTAAHGCEVSCHVVSEAGHTARTPGGLWELTVTRGRQPAAEESGASGLSPSAGHVAEPEPWSLLVGTTAPSGDTLRSASAQNPANSTETTRSYVCCFESPCASLPHDERKLVQTLPERQHASLGESSPEGHCASVRTGGGCWCGTENLGALSHRPPGQSAQS